MAICVVEILPTYVYIQYMNGIHFWNEDEMMQSMSERLEMKEHLKIVHSVRYWIASFLFLPFFLSLSFPFPFFICSFHRNEMHSIHFTEWTKQ